MSETKTPVELSLESAKQTIKANPGQKALHDLLDKKVSEIPQDKQKELATTPEGTVVLLHALAKESGTEADIAPADLEKIVAGDRSALLQAFQTLGSKQLDAATKKLLDDHTAVLQQVIEEKDLVTDQAKMEG